MFCALQASVERADDHKLAAAEAAKDRQERIDERAADIARAIVLSGEWLQWLDDRSIPLCDVRLREPHGYETLPLDHLLARALSAAARAPWAAGDLSILGERLIEWLATHEDVRAARDDESLQEP